MNLLATLGILHGCAARVAETQTPGLRASTTDECDAGTCGVAQCTLDAPFGEVTLVFASDVTADGFTLSRDELTAYVSRYETTQYDIYVATRSSASDRFGALSLVPNLNSGADDRAPWLSADGLQLYFWTKNTDNGISDLVVASRATAASAFGAPTAVSGVNSSVSDEDPFFAAGQQALYFVSDRPTGDRDPYVSRFENGAFTRPELVKALSSDSEEHRIVLTRDGLTAYIGSERSGFEGDTNGDIWMATRASTTSSFGTPVLVAGVNTGGKDFPVSLSRDGCTLYLLSNRDSGGGGTLVLKLYQTRRGPTRTNPVQP